MKIRSAMVVVAMATALVAGLAPSVSATPMSAQSCPVEILSAQYITWRGEPAQPTPTPPPPNAVGAVQLRTDNCGHYWAYVKMYHTLNSNEYAQGWISRWDHGVRTLIRSCDDGNGRIIERQNSCVTSMITSSDSSSLFLASAHYYYRTPPTYTWQDNYWGQTAATR